MCYCVALHRQLVLSPQRWDYHRRPRPRCFRLYSPHLQGLLQLQRLRQWHCCIPQHLGCSRCTAQPHRLRALLPCCQCQQPTPHSLSCPSTACEARHPQPLKASCHPSRHLSALRSPVQCPLHPAKAHYPSRTRRESLWRRLWPSVRLARPSDCHDRRLRLLQGHLRLRLCHRPMRLALRLGCALMLADHDRPLSLVRCHPLARGPVARLRAASSRAPPARRLRLGCLRARSRGASARPLPHPDRPTTRRPTAGWHRRRRLSAGAPVDPGTAAEVSAVLAPMRLCWPVISAATLGIDAAAGSLSALLSCSYSMRSGKSAPSAGGSPASLVARLLLPASSSYPSSITVSRREPPLAAAAVS